MLFPTRVLLFNVPVSLHGSLTSKSTHRPSPALASLTLNKLFLHGADLVLVMAIKVAIRLAEAAQPHLLVLALEVLACHGFILIDAEERCISVCRVDTYTIIIMSRHVVPCPSASMYFEVALGTFFVLPPGEPICPVCCELDPPIVIQTHALSRSTFRCYTESEGWHVLSCWEARQCKEETWEETTPEAGHKQVG